MTNSSTSVARETAAPGSFLQVLDQIERLCLPGLLQQPDVWRSLYVDYEPPIVERLWAPVDLAEGRYRVFLHRIHPAQLAACLFHPHPWPSVIKVLTGQYMMTCGFGKGLEPPPVSHTLLLPAGAAYEMVHPDGWHAVCPMGGPSLSLMVTGEPWTRDSHKPTKQLRELSATQRAALLCDFRGLYPGA